jgi:Lipopolysaccharide-assembly
MRSGANRRRARAALAAALALASCGYRVATRYEAKGGADRIHVKAFENLSTEPSLGAEVASELRRELDRRGAAAGPGARAFIDGDVRSTAPGPSDPRAATWHIGLDVRARLVVDGATVTERTVHRDAVYLAGVGGDALETEGRRTLALRRAAADAARQIVAELER